MSCRTTPAGSAFTTLARLGAGSELSDVATLSAFHRLRSEYGSLPSWQQYTDENASGEYYALLTQAARTTATAEYLSDARRASLQQRLVMAAGGERPDAPTVYALRRIQAVAEAEARARANFYSEYAQELEITAEEARARFLALEAGIDRARSASHPDSYTAGNIADALTTGLGREAGAVHAFATMRAEMSDALQARYANVPSLVERDIINSDPINLAEAGGRYGASVAAPYDQPIRILEYGQDRRSGRAEYVIQTADGQTHELAFRNFDRVLNGSNPETLASALRGAIGYDYYRYRNAEEQTRAGLARRCTICGQYATSRHACPVDQTGPVTNILVRNARTSNQNLPSLARGVALPLVTDLRTAANTGSVEMQSIREYVYARNTEGGGWESGTVTGDLGIIRDPETGARTYNTDQMRCTCGQFTANPGEPCTHINGYRDAVDLRLNPPSRSRASMTPEERAQAVAASQARADAAALADWTRNEALLAEAATTWNTDSDVNYATDVAAFMTDLTAAQTAISENGGAPTIPYLTDNALGGMGTRESGQGFGMEIEFELPSTVDRGTAIRTIARELHEAGITRESQQVGYGASRRYGMVDTHTQEDGTGTWSFERDGSVNGGELVTPIMYDEPETWEKLEKVTEILTRNGAIATTRAGAHVHVGTANYGGDPNKYAELARMMTQHEDVMFRLAQNPARGTHRQGQYSAPLPETPLEGWNDIGQIRGWGATRPRVLNLGAVNSNTEATSDDRRGDNVEFRIFDATLNPGAMQAQIKLALAMTTSAARIADAGISTNRAKEPLGSHAERAKARNSRRRMTDEEVTADTATFRSFMDTIFTRHEDKKQLTALFASTKWAKASTSNASAQRSDRYTSQRARAAAEAANAA